MTSVSTTRRCGNCGGAVAGADVVCPHCDALLAAYEAPAGATSGTAAAVLPVDASAPPAPAPASGPVASETTEIPAVESPIATAVAETREAAESAAPEPTAPAADEPWPLSSEPTPETVDLTELPAPSAATIPAPAPSTTPSPVREALADTKRKMDIPPAPKPTPGPRPTPVPVEAQPVPESVRRMREQRRDAWTTKAPEKKATSRFDGASLIVIGFAIFIFLRVAGSNAFFGTVLTLGAVALVIWFVMRLANATGRKTTDMPRDDSWRRKR